jgi:hypothetical protein
MKRSEMIRLMAYAWKDYVMNLKSPDDADVAKGMNAVLETMESEGMAPPVIAKFIPTAEVESIDVNRGLIKFTTGETFGTVNEWESEDA